MKKKVNNNDFGINSYPIAIDGMASWMNEELLKPEWRDIKTPRDDILCLVAPM